MQRRTTTRTVTKARAGGQRRRNTLLWSAAVAAIVIGLIYKEQVALLYVLASLSVTALLIVVALADLGGARRMPQTAPFDDSAALGDNLTPRAMTADAAPRANASQRR